MRQRRVFSRVAAPAVAILLVLTAWAAHRSAVFSRFDTVTVELSGAELYPSQHIVAVPVRPLAELTGQTAVLEVVLRNLDAEPKQIALLLPGLENNRVEVPPDRTIRWTLVLPPDVLRRLNPADNGAALLEFTGNAAGWAVAGLQLRNYHRRGGEWSVVLPESSGSYTPAAAPSLMWVVVAGFALALALGRSPRRRSIEVVGRIFAAAALLVCVACLIVPRISPYKLLLSQSTFWLVATALFAPAVFWIIGLSGAVSKVIVPVQRYWMRHEVTFERGAAFFGLAAISVAQPVFDVVSNSPEFFAARGTSPATLVAAVLAIALGLPALPLAIERMVRVISARGAIAWVAGVIAILLAALVMGWFRRTESLGPRVEIFVSIAIGAGVAITYVRSRLTRQFFTALAPAALVVPALFLLDPDVQQSFLPSESAAAVPAPERTPPVVLVIFDELPLNSLLDARGELDAGRYPNFAALARNAYWFRNASTVSYDTTHAVPAILSGRYPIQRNAVPTLRYYPVNLFTALARHYEIVASIRFQKLCPQQACASSGGAAGDSAHALLADLGLLWLHMVLPEPLTEELPPVAGDWADLAAQEPGAANSRGGMFADFVSHIDEHPARLYVMHSMLPHMAFEYVPSGRRYRAPDYQTTIVGGRKLFEKVSAAYADTLHQRHLAQVGFVDRLVGELVDRLRKAGVYDRALVIITADHGASYREGRSRREPIPQQENLSDILQVPLFIKMPAQQRGVTVDRVVETVDIFPTILDVLGVKASLRLDGRSLTDAAEGDDEPRTFVLRDFDAPPRPVGDLVADRAASLERKQRRFAAGDPKALYASPETRHLIGRPFDRSARRSATDVAITIRNPEQWADVKPDREILPLYVRGVLRTSRPAPLRIAVVVNGVVEAVTESFLDRRGHVFGTLIPERALREGRNTVEAFVVDE